MGKRVYSTTVLTGTALLSALVIVFDYALRYSGLKLPFPWYPNLKFDFTGVPIVLGLLMYGLPSATVTALVAGIGIFVRSGNFLSASMKSVAELATVGGMSLGIYFSARFKPAVPEEGSRRLMSVVTVYGLFSRVLLMTLVNWAVLPLFYGVPIEVTYGLLPLIGVFNAIQGGVTILLGFFFNDAVRRRLPDF